MPPFTMVLVMPASTTAVAATGSVTWPPAISAMESAMASMSAVPASSAAA